MITTAIPDGLSRPASHARRSGNSPSALAAIYDAELVRQFNAGNEAAFVEIVARFRQRVFATAFSLLHNHADAEDITQDTFIRAHRGLARFRGDSSLATWLHRIATNLSRNLYWHLVRRGRKITASLDCPLAHLGTQTFADVLTITGVTPSHFAAHDEFTTLVAGCFDKLQAPQREILTLRNELEQSYAEIADALGIEVGTVKSRIARARVNLRRLIADTCPEFGAGAPLLQWFEPRRAPGQFTTTSG